MPDPTPFANLDAIFEPRSIAVIGASRDPGSVGNDLFRNLLFSGFQGPVYPVNPKATSILGVYAYASMAEVPGPVDLAVVIIPARFVPGIVDQAAAKGVRAMVVISAGFKETGPAGADLERQLCEAARSAGIPLIGPNCLGIINTDPRISMNATFARKMPRPGSLAFVSQSGALCTSVLDYAEERRMGFSKFLSFGNKADINEIDLLSYLGQDKATKVIAMYLEDVSHGRRFLDTARNICWQTGTPMLCLKSGRSPEGARAVSSHTGSLAGSDSIYDALLMQSGVQRVETIAELFDCAMLYTAQPMPKGNRVAIVTNAGGPGIMATDVAVRHGLQLATFSEATTQKLRDALPRTASTRNPVDVIGDAKSDRYQAAIRAVLEDPNVDSGVVILTPQSMTDVEETARIVPLAAQGVSKPVVCSFMGVGDVADGVRILRHQGIPNYAFPEDAVKSMAAASKLVGLWEVPHRETVAFEDVDAEKARRHITEALGDRTERYLTQVECRLIFECYRLPLLKNALATDADQAAELAVAFGVPVAMKVMSQDVVHKYDAGGVLLKIQGADAARAAYQRIVDNVRQVTPDACIDGILVEEMARKGQEIILGASRDPRFGPLMMFGLGGTFVEVLKDVTFRLAPMWRISAQRMIRQINAYKILTGVRGNPPSDLESVEEILLRLSQLVCDHPEIAELDINPLIVHEVGKGCSVADSRIMLRNPGS